MTFFYYLFIIISVLYLLVAIPTAFLCVFYVVSDLASTFFIPEIKKVIKKSRYKKTCVVVCDKKNTNYYVCIIYNNNEYHFFNKKLYNAVQIGDMFYVPVYKRNNKLFLKIPYKNNGKKYFTIKSRKISS